jgi:DnaK suppressor protein
MAFWFFNIKYMVKTSKQKTDQKMDSKTLKKIESDLLKRKKQITNSLAEVSKADYHESDLLTAKFPEYGDKADENAQEISDYSTNIASEKVLEKALEDINKALESIKKGSYGICKYCGQEINKKRLLARPVASSCISCKSKLQENE